MQFRYLMVFCSFMIVLTSFLFLQVARISVLANQFNFMKSCITKSNFLL